MLFGIENNFAAESTQFIIRQLPVPCTVFVSLVMTAAKGGLGRRMFWEDVTLLWFICLHARLMAMFNDEFVDNHHKIVKRSPGSKFGRYLDRRGKRRERCRKLCKQSKLLFVIAQLLFNHCEIIVQSL